MLRSREPRNALMHVVAEAISAAGPVNSILLDGSTEALLVAEHLLALPPLTITTPGLEVACYLSETSKHTVIVLGGELHRHSRSMLVDDSIGNCPPIDIGFFGAASYTSTTGLIERESGLAASKRRLVERCRVRCGVLGASKMESFGPYGFLAPTALAQLIVVEDESLPFDVAEESWTRSHQRMRSPPTTSRQIVV